MIVKDVYNAINSAADFSLAMGFDNVGLLVGDPDAMVKGVLIALDVTDNVIDEAVARGANLIVTHHPVIFNPMKRVTADTLVWRLIRADISVISAHTNLDIAKGGVNDILAQTLGLEEVVMLEQTSDGEGLGRIGTLPRGMTPPEFAYYVKRMLNAGAVRYCDGGCAIEKVAVGGGSCGSLLDVVAKSGCQAFVTGDVKHDVMLDAVHRGITLIDAGHFCTENLVVEYLAKLTQDVLGETPVMIAKSNIDVATTI
ncbi:Nif3-like dinuclear metal center hexameric protein [Oscillospiraceae bacterium PP1C4]